MKLKKEKSKLPDKDRKLVYQLFKLFSLELLRNKIGLLLLAITPATFLLIAHFTTKDLKIPIKLYYFKYAESLLVSQSQIHIVYIGATVLGFLCAYYATVIFQKNLTYYKYCIAGGLPFNYYYFIRLVFLIIVVSLLSILICFVISIFMPVNRFVFIFMGLFFTGMIYAVFGGIIGVISKNFMVSFLAIILLANLDVGWMQNPLFYTYAKNTFFIRYLPAFFPCQFVFSASFGNKINFWACYMSIAYIFFLFIVLYIVLYAVLIGFSIRNKIKKIKY